MGEALVSWKATAWALGQTTGAARRKLLLLALANYADETGVCWPSQETLARDTEQSVDTVQRQLDVLGQWQGYHYTLCLQTGCGPKGQSAARRPYVRLGQAAISAPTRPQSLRLKPSIEPSSEPSRKIANSNSAERLLAFQKKQEGAEVVQNRIARRIGSDGWLVLGEMNDGQRSRLSTLERQGRLDDATLIKAVLEIRLGSTR
jgi:hypothetical protein